MKILHLFSNWKWTGPAEPALNLAAAQKLRGHQVTMAIGDAGDHEKHFHSQVARRGVDLLEGMVLDKHLEFLKNRRDIKFLSRYLKDEKPDLIQTHLTNDHLIAGRARAKSGYQAPLVRACYDAFGPESGLRNRYLLRRHTDALVVASTLAREKTLERFPFLKGRVFVVEPGIETERFDPARSVPDKRAEFGIRPADFVVGMVARVQAKRRYDVFLEAVRQVREKLPELKVFIIGGGTNIKTVAQDPVKQMGLESTVLFTGIQRGDDYLGLLQAMDILVFLFPGSDNSSRAVREAMSMEVPVIAARRGMLPEIVTDGKTGLVIEDTPGNLAASILDLARNREKRQRMSREAGDAARKRFALPGLADAYDGVYRELFSRLNR